MDVSRHFFLGLLFSIVCISIYPSIGLIGFSLIFFSSFLIDFDHYMYYFYKNKNLSLKKAYKRGIQNRDKFRAMPLEKRGEVYAGLFFMHGVETLSILFLLGVFVSKYFIFIFTGFGFHLLLDSVHQLKHLNRIDKFCILHDFRKFKKLKFIEEHE